MASRKSSRRKPRKSKWGTWTCPECGAEISAGHTVVEHQRSQSCTRRREIKRLETTGYVVIPDSWGASLVSYRVLTEKVVRGWTLAEEGRLKMAYWLYEWLAVLIGVPYKRKREKWERAWSGYLEPAQRIPDGTLGLAADLLRLTTPTDFEILNSAARLGGPKALADLAKSIVEEGGQEVAPEAVPDYAACGLVDGLIDQFGGDDDDD